MQPSTVVTPQVANYLADVPGYYKGKSILITGATGFLAKILLAKLIDSCPDFKTVYLMIRGKKSQKIEERLKKQILNTECLQIIFDKKPHLKQQMKTRIIPVQGDLVQEGLGLNSTHRKMLTDNLDVIVSCAASVYFHDPLQETLQVNYFGPLRLLKLAKECKKTPAFVHVSTMYVNCNRPPKTLVEEKIYEDSIQGDPEEKVREIMSMQPNDAIKNVQKIVGDFPNTYTYTKHLAEKALVKLRGHIPLAITRPSIVISSIKDPAPGWIDSLAGAGVVTYALGNGQKHVIRLGLDVPFDVIPADYTVNAIILAAPAAAMNPQNSLLYQSGTSVANPVLIRDYFQQVTKEIAYNQSPLQERSPFLIPINNREMYDVANWFDIKAPLVPLQILSQIPFIGNDQMNQLLALGMKRSGFMQVAFDQLDHFMQNYWLFDCKELNKLADSLPQNTREIFPIDARMIDWDQTIQDFVQGMRKYMMHQEQPQLGQGYKQLIRQNQLPWFHSPRLMITKNSNLEKKSTNELFSNILNNQKFQEYLALNQESIKMYLSEVQGDYKKIQIDMNQAKLSLRKLSSKVSPSTVIPLFSFMNMIFRRALEGLFVDQDGLQTVRDLMNSGEKVILMPTYKSFTDQFVLNQTFLLQDMDIPFALGCYEDTPRYQLYDSFLGKMGYILNQRKSGQPLQDQYLNSQLLFEIINKYSLAIVYQNDKRLQTGKFRQPMKGDCSINWILHAHKQMGQNAKKLHIVPVSINYDRLMEMKILAMQMVSGSNPQLSLTELMQKLKQFNNQQLGKCTVKFLQPINVSNYCDINQFMPLTPQNFQEASFSLTESLYREQSKNAYVTLNMMVATFLLQEKRSTLSMKDLVKKCMNLYNYLKQNYTAMLMTRVPNQMNISKQVTGLGFTVTQKGKDQIISLDARQEMRTMLSLAYYSIGLFSHGMAESASATVIKTHFKQSSEPLTIYETTNTLRVLDDIFRGEYVKRDAKSMSDTMIHRISKLSKFGEIVYDELNQTIDLKRGGTLINFYSEMGMFLLETYYVVLMTIHFIQSKTLRLQVDKLVDQIHEALKELYALQVVKNLHACLDETIRTSIHQYGRNGLAKIKNYSNTSGSEATFISVPEKYKEQIDETLDVLTKQLFLTTESVDQVEEAVQKAIEEASVIQLAKM